MNIAPKMTPQEGLVVLIELSTTKCIEFQNLGQQGVNGYDFLEVGCRDFFKADLLRIHHLYSVTQSLSRLN